MPSRHIFTVKGNNAQIFSIDKTNWNALYLSPKIFLVEVTSSYTQGVLTSIAISFLSPFSIILLSIGVT